MKNDRNQGGPTRSRKDEPTDDRSHVQAQSREVVSMRSVKGERPGRGKRNGSDKNR
jgi:hypothetical protein